MTAFPDIQIDGERFARGVAQRAAAALAEAWLDAARQDAVVQALLEERNIAVKAAEGEGS